MSAFLEYLWTTFTRLWDIITYPFEFVASGIAYIQNQWGYVSSVQSLFPPWLVGSIVACFALGIVLLVLKR